jgi:hypothetical protein
MCLYICAVITSICVHFLRICIFLFSFQCELLSKEEEVARLRKELNERTVTSSGQGKKVNCLLYKIQDRFIAK